MNLEISLVNIKDFETYVDSNGSEVIVQCVTNRMDDSILDDSFWKGDLLETIVFAELKTADLYSLDKLNFLRNFTLKN